ncbi:hypothetical protein RGQ13_13750 [Thalassotalea psychrophila]|uniref:Uncharacterized protein n=1 Tax=Thalassotalea psychrophila TaxID=3065647 RepID=A0ABY9TTV7_9GAMM|nr:hypothetical protein RGQ13_13750 [Colwelliaceae bacterium SQ149]
MKQKITEIIKNTKAYNWLRHFLYSTCLKDYSGEFLNEYNANEYIKDLINSNNPFMVSRLGSTELSVLRSFKNNVDYNEKQRETIQSLSGFFPVTTDNLNLFSEMYFKHISNIDVLGIWMNPFEDVIANEYCENAFITKLRSLEPYFYSNPWTSALKDKKVLVVHPFNNSIEGQYKNRKLLFKDESVLPEFELSTYQAVQSLGGDSDTYSSWFEALEGMQNDISKLDFDIAIIGAGAYGLPLASFIKKSGRSAIHLGGATQLLFGVYGRRWEVKEDFKDIINENWVRPTENEKPKAAKNVENSCYW